MAGAFTLGPGGQLVWGAPTPEAAGTTTPAGTQPSGAMPLPLPGMPTMTAPTESSSSPGLVPYKPGPITQTVNDLLTASIQGGSKGGPAGSTLYSLSGGNVPPALLKQFNQNLKQEGAAITEGFGVTGNRFSTDLARTLSDAAGRANVNLAAQSMQMALDAISQIIGLGKGQSSIEFAGDQAALDRANQDFLASSSQDTLNQILASILGTGTLSL